MTLGHLAELMDADRSDRITRREFAKGLAMVGVHPAPAVLNSLFRFCDRDHDGSVDWHELKDALGRSRRKHAKQRSGRAKDQVEHAHGGSCAATAVARGAPGSSEREQPITPAATRGGGGAGAGAGGVGGNAGSGPGPGRPMDVTAPPSQIEVRSPKA